MSGMVTHGNSECFTGICMRTCTITFGNVIGGSVTVVPYAWMYGPAIACSPSAIEMVARHFTVPLP